MPTEYQRWDRNGADAALIVKEYIAGRAHIGRFSNFIAGRREWLEKYKPDRLKRNFKKTIERYEAWKRGGKRCIVLFKI